MYAIITSGGKQYKATNGQIIKLEKLEAEVGSKIELPVLMLANGEQVEIGTPLLTQRSVSAEVISHGRGDKVKIIKMRRRKHYRKQMGHRQYFTEVKITAIN